MVLASTSYVRAQAAIFWLFVLDFLAFQQQPSTLRRARYVDFIRYHRPLRAGTLLGCFLAVFAYFA